MKINPILNTDFYKISHSNEVPEGETFSYSNLTPRSSKYFTTRSEDYQDTIVMFKVQVMLMQLQKLWHENFFSISLSETLPEYVQILQESLGIENPNTQFVEDLHELGYLPIVVKSIDEGTIVPIKLPILTIHNTDPRFSGLVNYLETYISANLWKGITMATVSNEFKQILKKYNTLTSDVPEGMPFQVHDFAARGLGNSEEWSTNSIAHLTSFNGTDTVQAIPGAKHYYNAAYNCGGSVPATEHRTMTTNINLIMFKQNVSQLKAEKLYLKQLLTKTYPTGIISVVCDSYDFWGVIETNLPALKETIMQRDGKLVIRPDSGIPIDIICGTEGSWNNQNTPNKNVEQKGLLNSLWEIFGGTINSKGYKVLDPHIGLIYGDGITVQAYEAILKRMETMKFSSDNLIVGIGAYSQTMMTRDTLGFAVKCTMSKINGQYIEINKKPKTDLTKISAKGFLKVYRDENNLIKLKERCSEQEEQEGLLKLRLKNGELYNLTTLEEIRQRLDSTS
ncbi:MAG: nicotinate phosphoribosyltransferase [Bacteroidales bacterium]|nr:nicotinate phosphoribosyltransferase [Bacteroidales bacterium]